jgi:YggT family protein
MYALRVLDGLLVVYLMLLSTRIILSWFRGSVHGRAWELLIRITDPYLSAFSRLRFLRQGMFDFTPIAAILVLVVCRRLVSTVLEYGTITLGLVLSLILQAVWSGVSFLVVLFMVLAIIKAVSAAMLRGRETTFSRMVTMMVQPLISLVARNIPLKRRLTELQYTTMTIALLFVVNLVGRALIMRLAELLVKLPV